MMFVCVLFVIHLCCCIGLLFWEVEEPEFEPGIGLEGLGRFWIFWAGFGQAMLRLGFHGLVEPGWVKLGFRFIEGG